VENTIEVLSAERIESEKWIIQYHMPKKLMGIATVALDFIIFIVGGFEFNLEDSMKQYSLSNKVYCFDTQKR
ncbi:MAG: hypothetical protein MHPSP_004658, partial [Paramarteilia canceri]